MKSEWIALFLFIIIVISVSVINVYDLFNFSVPSSDMWLINYTHDEKFPLSHEENANKCNGYLLYERSNGLYGSP